ncbi:MAG: 30S ribosomal protein S7 [Patescibacteria group bacterium]|mgnify:CR=1 FL=1
MRGRSFTPKHRLELEERYQDPGVTKLINKIMRGGKKATATKIVYTALESLAKKRGTEAPVLLRQAMEKASPILEVRSRRVGGASYQVPMEVRPNRKVILVMRWLLTAARGAKGIPMARALENELENIFNDTGSVLKHREDLHKMAEANRAFAHFARY